MNGTMIQDKLVRFAGVEFECVDEGFGENMPVDVVVRPEDWYIFSRFGCFTDFQYRNLIHL